MATILIALIRLYQLTLSRVLLALLGPVCRFEPSCSRYAVACIASHGAVRGTLLSAKRLCRCHPFHPGGYDPPPPPEPARTRALKPSDTRTREPGERVQDSQPEPLRPGAGTLPKSDRARGEA